MILFHLTLLVLFASLACSSDYCAWNRGVEAVDEDNAGTYNFINGNYYRSYDVESGGQSALWHGMPYYKMSNDGYCFVLNNLWLYRYINSQVYPPTFTWVIATEVGTKPINGYAYCGPDETPSISDLSSPIMCDGKWKIGQPEDNTRNKAAGQETDVFFSIIPGGCPQINCNQLKFCGNNNDVWTDDTTEGSFKCMTYDYVNGDPNTYVASSVNSETGKYYLFFNHNVFRWAVSESITGTLDKENCELYKYGKGFTAVANVNAGDTDDPDIYTPWYQSSATNGNIWYWKDTLTTTQTRRIQCIGM